MEKRISYQLLEEAQLARVFGKDSDGIITIPSASHNNCGSRCVIKIKIQNGRILGLTTDNCTDVPDNLQIRSCLKGHSYLDTFLHPDRLLYPQKRVGRRGEGKFARITWEEATDTIAGEMKRIKNTYGAASRYCNYATGYEMCCATPAAMMKRLLALDGGYLGYYNNYSNSPSSLSARLTYGTEYTGNSRSDFVNSKYIILWGYNPAETVCGGNTMYYLAQAKKNGAKIVVIDSRFSDTAAALADQWIAPLPTTDSALSDAIAYVIYKNGLHDQHFLDTYCLGFDDATLPAQIPKGASYLAYLLGETDNTPKTPRWAAEITGVSAAVIETLAKEYATAKPAAILEGYGPARHAYGEQFSRGLITLCCMTKNVGISGGSAAGVGQVPSGAYSLPQSPNIPANPYPGKIPCFSWTDMITDASSFTAKEGLIGVERLDTNIKMIFNLAGNCLINQHGDCNRTAKLLADPANVEFIVCSDIFMTPSARYADLLLPGTTMLETENITASPARFDHFFKINPVMEPPKECRFDYDWISDVSGKLGLQEAFTEQKTLHQWLCEAVAQVKNKDSNFPNMEDFTRQGVYKGKCNHNYIAFQQQIQDFAHHPFDTPSGKIQLFVPSLYHRHDPKINPIPGYIPAWEGPADSLREKYPLQCIGFHTKARTHSVHDNNEALQKLVPQEAWMHPEDAKNRGILADDMILIYNNRGKIRMPVKITSRIAPGVLAIPQGAWFTPDETGVDIRGCINTITSLRPTPIAKANAQHTNLVQAARANEVQTERNEVQTERNEVQTESANEMPGLSRQTVLPLSASKRSGCSGCFTCIAACPHGNMQVTEMLTAEKNRPVTYQPVSCHKCKDPACVSSCPLRILP